MEQDKIRLLTVSEVAKALGVNITTIRYYNRVGLIWSERDNENNYRYYNEEQLPNFKIILELRAFGFSVEKIKEIKKYIISKKYDFIVEMMKKQEKEYEEKIKDLKDKISKMENRRKHMEYLNDINKADPEYMVVDSQTHEFKVKEEGMFYVKQIEGIDYAIFYAGRDIPDRDAVNILFEKAEEMGYRSVGDLRIEVINPVMGSEVEHKKIKIFKIPIKSLT